MHADATTSTCALRSIRFPAKPATPKAFNLEALGVAAASPWHSANASCSHTRRSEITSERPPAETIVDAGFDRIDRHCVASDKGAAVTAEIEVVVLDLRTPVVPEGIFGPDADNPAACCPAGRAAEAERRVDADAN